jgi:hypothetical protein
VLKLSAAADQIPTCGDIFERRSSQVLFFSATADSIVYKRLFAKLSDLSKNASEQGKRDLGNSPLTTSAPWLPLGLHEKRYPRKTAYLSEEALWD